MLLTSVILVLQEMLEASLVISVLLAFSVHNQISRNWIWYALAAGIASAFFYARNIETMSEWFDYMGLEIVNASIQFMICLWVALFACFRLPGVATGKSPVLLPVAMALIVCLAIAREGFEVLLYGSGVAFNSEQWSPVLIGSVLGGGIGMSIGALLYYGLISMNGQTGQRVLLVLLCMFSGNMAAQGTLLLIQADWLPSGQAIWNTSFLIPEDNLVGQLLYALVGYEAAPTALQAGAYGLVFLVILILFSLRWPGFNNTQKAQ